MNLFSELKRRNVFRVAIAYTVIAWLTAQVSDLVLDAISAPTWVMQTLLFILALGFVVSVVISWAYEVTEEGIKKEQDVDRSKSVTHQTAKKLDIITISALVLVTLLIVVDRFYTKPDTQPQPETILITEQEGNSIAVLPFIDLSQKGDEGYFADGISEEILNVLVRIPKLKVAGRTSSFSFKGRNEDLRKIGEALGVNHILEGSVRRSGSKLRITAQLIRGEDGFHLWSETYDREATDIFKIQDEIARAVAKQLALSLGLSSKSLVKDRTDDIVAYEKYLQAKQLHLARGKDNLDTALLLLQEVVARDPNFAPAWTTIAQVYSVYAAYQPDGFDLKKTAYWRDIGMAAANRSIVLNPLNPAALTQQGNFYAYDYQWIKAFESFDKALSLSSHNADFIDSIAQSMLDTGYFDEALALSKKAVKNDSLVAIYHITLGRVYAHLGEYDKAISQFNEVIRLNPKMVFSYNNLMNIYLSQLKIDDAVAAGSLLVKNRNSGQEDLEFLKLLRDNKNNKAELNKLLKGNEYTWQGVYISMLLDDIDVYLTNMQFYWSQKYRNTPSIFTGDFGNKLFNHPLWKAQIRKDGMLKLWRSRGFPPQCRELPDSDVKDDFECSVHNSMK